MKLGGEVRLKNAYIIKAESVVKDANGEIAEIHCTYSEDTSRRVKGTLHWVSIKHAIKAEVREYDRLFSNEAPDSHPDKGFMELINSNSKKVIEAYLEPSLKDAKVGDRFQFQRLGYFNVDEDSTSDKLVFNKTVGLREVKLKVDSAVHKHKVDNIELIVNPQQQSQRKPIDRIKQLGKKYTNLPEEKQKKTKAEIQELANNVSYDDLQPLFGTAVKKVGTRIATMISLGVLLDNGLSKNEEIKNFINKALEDKNKLLVAVAKAI